jgi:hypothetical protein
MKKNVKHEIKFIKGYGIVILYYTDGTLVQ